MYCSMCICSNKESCDLTIVVLEYYTVRFTLHPDVHEI